MPMWMSLGLSVALLINVPFLGNVDLHRLWRSTRHPRATAAAALAGGIHVPLGHMPAALSPFLGPGGPAINVNGSENIRISGTSNWTNQQVGPLGQKRS